MQKFFISKEYNYLTVEHDSVSGDCIVRYRGRTILKEKGNIENAENLLLAYEIRIKEKKSKNEKYFYHDLLNDLYEEYLSSSEKKKVIKKVKFLLFLLKKLPSLERRIYGVNELMIDIKEKFMLDYSKKYNPFVFKK